MEPRLKEKYKKEIIPKMLKNRKFNNVMELPRINKITVNMGIGSAIQNIKELESASQDLAKITGQKPVITKARKSVAGFKLRQGNPIGCMVTLRGKRMYEFLDRLLSIAIPRIRDFRGLSKKSFDGSGNYTIGIKEQLIFPEVEYDSILSVKGMNITITTSAENDDEALFLLEEFGFPFKK
ncbi:MAG: 50S ribosomal protein L5 [Candidatus Hydromicrobium sp.]|jgi:large subunit ribosomal protein L5|nr:50S ribosomal protein L5 [Actinomycetota bacterium]MCJ7727063.1 50S ribosomal protein L5 [Actinomycetota bacterium]MDP3011670.1 50S ribosomal protein L5 [Candidatus Hydromicrobium sp.]